MTGFFRRRRRKERLARPLSEDQVQFLQLGVPYYQVLTAEEREALHGHMQVILAEKHFDAVDGLVLTPQMTWLIAGQAAVLLLGRDMDYFPRLTSIVIFPETFSSTIHHRRGAGVVTEEEVRRVGESWQLGTVLLSWRQVLVDTQLNSARHVIFHEFAHQIDQADGAADGWPGNLDPAQEAVWAKVMAEEFAALRAASAAGTFTVLDPYGATKPTEFFSTLTEIFFLRPRLLHRDHPALFDLLREFYGQDPRPRFTPEGTGIQL